MTESETKKNKFEKKYIQNWSTKIFKVVSVSRINKNFKLMNIETNNNLVKRYYEDQLLKIDNDKLIKSEKVKDKTMIVGKIGTTIIKTRIRNNK